MTESWTLDEELAGRQDPTQVGAALEALAIEPIFALSPQAKGRAERLFRTLQDRLVALLRLEGISDIAAANAYVGNGFLDHFNQHFSVAPEEPCSVWRKPPRAEDRERVLALSYEATVGNDNTVRFAGLVIDVPPGPRRRSYARCRVQVRQLLDGSWHVYYQDQLIATAPATEIAELIRTKRRRKGVRAAHDAAWVFAASAPGVAPREHLLPGLKSAPAAIAQRTPSSLRPGPIRRARPGRIIKATRIA